MVKKIIFEFFEDFLNIFKDIKNRKGGSSIFLISSKDFEVGKCLECEFTFRASFAVQDPPSRGY